MNKRVVFLLTLTFFTMLSSYTLAFNDIEEHWAKDVINSAKNMKIINGYEDDSFRPDEPMTRAELVSVINRLLGIQTESDKYIPDVTRQEWFHSDIRKAMYMGIIKGDENGYIRPYDYVTREQAVLMMYRAFGMEKRYDVSNAIFSDAASISEWSKTEFFNFIDKQYIHGYSDNTVRPKENITRAEILTILDRIIDTYSIGSAYNEKISGIILLKDKNIFLKNVEIYGDLIIGENAVSTLMLNNVIISGNLILYAPIDFKSSVISVKGRIINLYENEVSSNLYYKDEIYGIEFSLPDGAKVINFKDITQSDYADNDLIIVDILQNDRYYFEDIRNISNEEIKMQGYDSIYEKIESGKLNLYPYELYKDNAKTSLLVIKRDNIAYTFMFINIISDNIIDNLMSSIQFFEGKKVVEHNENVYKNSKLCLKFTYRDGYVGIDDSYNTGVIYSGDAFFKLFIQVNMITDISEYSIERVTALLKTLIQSDGEIINEEVKKIINHDAIQFEIVSGDDKTISLFVIVGNNLYNFIFKGTKDQMDSIGKDMFNDMINSMEF